MWRFSASCQPVDKNLVDSLNLAPRHPPMCHSSGLLKVPLKVHVRGHFPALKGQCLHARYVSNVDVSDTYQNRYKYLDMQARALRAPYDPNVVSLNFRYQYGRAFTFCSSARTPAPAGAS